MLTVGSVLTTNVSQTNLCQLLFIATLKVRLDLCTFVTTLGMDSFDCTKMNAHFKKIHSLSMGGAHSRVEASITSPTSPPYACRLTIHGSVPHSLISCILVHMIYISQHLYSPEIMFSKSCIVFMMSAQNWNCVYDWGQNRKGFSAIFGPEMAIPGHLILKLSCMGGGGMPPVPLI